MVLANYELFDYSHLEEVTNSKRSTGDEPGGMLSPNQDEAQLEDSVLSYRDVLLTHMHSLKTHPGFERYDERSIQINFCHEVTGYMGLIPGSLSSVWGPTGAEDWLKFAENLRVIQQKCEAERDRRLSVAFAQGVSPKTHYTVAVENTSKLLGLVATHFEEAASAQLRLQDLTLSESLRRLQSL